MRMAVSPYHLTTREPAAMAALLLADRVATLLPTPTAGAARDDLRRAASRVPAFVRIMESWSWSVPLWQAGVIARAIEGHDATPDVRHAYQRVHREPDLAPLRALMRAELFEGEDVYLEALSRDVLRAGPDPGITVPVAAGLDAFAARVGGVVARSDPSSVVQRAEATLGSRVLTVALPVLLQASGRRVVHARAILAEVLDPLREALARAMLAHDDARADAIADLAVAAREYAVAFAEARDELTAGPDDTDEDHVRVVEGTVALTGLLLPADAVFRASIAALRTMAPAAARPRPGTERPAPVDALAPGRPTATLLVRVMGRSKR